MHNNYASLLFQHVVKWAECTNESYDKNIKEPLGLDSEMIGANWKINKLFWAIVCILQFFEYFFKGRWMHYLNQIFLIRLQNKTITSKKLYQLAFNIGKLRRYHLFWKYIWIYINMEDFIQINGINNVIIAQNTYNKIIANLII